MQTVYFVFIAALLFQYTLIEIQRFVIFLLLRIIHLTLYFPQ